MQQLFNEQMSIKLHVCIPLAPAKKQLSSAQKASLARAREKARQSKLAKSQAKADQQKEFVKYHQAVTKQASPAKDQSDTEMSDSESEPSPSPVKHKKGKKIKRFAKKKRKVETSSDSETSEDDPLDARARTANQAALAKQVYENNMARIKGEVVYKSLFPYLQG